MHLLSAPGHMLQRLRNRTAGMNAFAIRHVVRAGCWVIGIVSASIASPAVSAQQPDPAPGLYITVQNPIVDAGTNDIFKRIERAQVARNVKKVIFDFNPDNAEANTDDYFAGARLAKVIKRLNNNGITTVAFVHAKTTG